MPAKGPNALMLKVIESATKTRTNDEFLDQGGYVAVENRRVGKWLVHLFATEHPSARRPLVWITTAVYATATVLLVYWAITL